MNLTGPFEAKVAASTAVPVVVGAVFTAAAYYHWFTPPPLPVIASIVTILTGAAGWLAPHTSRSAPAPATSTMRRQWADFEAWVDAGKPTVIPLNPPPQVQPPATTTGPAS